MSGGAFSQLRLAFFVLPVGAALLMSPRAAALWSAISVLSYVGASSGRPRWRASSIAVNARAT